MLCALATLIPWCNSLLKTYADAPIIDGSEKNSIYEANSWIPFYRMSCKIELDERLPFPCFAPVLSFPDRRVADSSPFDEEPFLEAALFLAPLPSLPISISNWLSLRSPVISRVMSDSGGRENVARLLSFAPLLCLTVLCGVSAN